MKRVLIVQEGQWGSVQKDDYQKFTDWCVEILSDVKTAAGEKEAIVEVVATAAEAEVKIRLEALNQKTDVVIFLSRSMGGIAKEFTAKFPEKKIIVFTGLIPKDQVIWINKLWISSRLTLREIVLSG